MKTKDLKDTESEWINFEAGIHPSYICSNCGYTALNDYRGRSTASRFCPHCGKFMINHYQPED